jgi:hypothetical protein
MGRDGQGLTERCRSGNYPDSPVYRGYCGRGGVGLCTNAWLYSFLLCVCQRGKCYFAGVGGIVVGGDFFWILVREVGFTMTMGTWV